jgi:hypothetical protein
MTLLSCICRPVKIARVKRKSLLERTVFSWLGLFPWGCEYCGKRLYQFRRHA